MKTFKLSVIIDAFFIFFTTFFLIYAMVIYGGAKISVSTTVSTLLAIITSLGYVIYKVIKNSKNKERELKDDQVKKLGYSLIFMNKIKLNNFLLKLVNKCNLNAKIVNGNLICTDKKIIIAPLFKQSKISEDDVISVYKSARKNYSVIIFCVSVSEEAKKTALLAPIQINFLDINKIYNLATLKNIPLPDCNLNLDKEKFKFKEFFKSLLTYKNSTKFLLIGLIIFLSSFFTFYPAYYIFFAVVFASFGLYLRLFKNKTIINDLNDDVFNDLLK